MSKSLSFRREALARPTGESVETVLEAAMLSSETPAQVYLCRRYSNTWLSKPPGNQADRLRDSPFLKLGG